jgi:hypothetical protein
LADISLGPWPPMSEKVANQKANDLIEDSWPLSLLVHVH